MDKVFLRTLQARNQAVKRSRGKDMQEFRDTRHKMKEQLHRMKISLQSDITAERKNRREDWLLGPLAPNRLAGKDAGGYGMLHQDLVVRPNVLPAKREKYFNFAVNDRVVVTKGRERGKIGRVQDIQEEKQTVTLKDMNMADVNLQPTLRKLQNLKTPFAAFPLPVHIHEIRLVVPLRDNATGKVRDTVVEHIRAGAPLIKPAHGSSTPEHTRYIAGPDNITIPWPKAADPSFVQGPSDTPGWEVSSRTFSPSLKYRPHPESLLDELRDKYSRTRTQHTQNFIQQKMMEDAKQQWASQRRMILPRQEFWEREAKEFKATGEPEITKETLELIQTMQTAKLEKHPAGAKSTAA